MIHYMSIINQQESREMQFRRYFQSFTAVLEAEVNKLLFVFA